MNAQTVLYRVTCTADDPQASARVMGVFAARSLLPQRFAAVLSRLGTIDIEIELTLEEGEGTGPSHLARVIERFPTVARVQLTIDGVAAAFDVGAEVCP